MPGELEILQTLLPQLAARADIAVGPGDDCAVLNSVSGGEQLLATVDQLISGIHFTPETSPQAAGEKLMKRNLSDIAAMSGTPRWALITTAANGTDNAWITEFLLAASRCGEAFDTITIGGDIASLPAPGFAAALTLIGTVPAGKALLRSGAAPGDSIFVTGTIGNSFLSGHHLDFMPRLAEGVFLRGRATAAMDISDGLLLDARRMAEASGVDLLIDPAAVPLRRGAILPDALGDGEDYELLFTAPAGIAAVWHSGLAPLTCIGRVVPAAGRRGRVLDIHGNPFDLHKVGYEH